MKMYFFIILIFSLFVSSNTEDSKINYAESLSKYFERFDKNLRSESKDEQKKAIENILPLKNDISVLFPEHTDLIWNKIEPKNKELIENYEEVAKELTRTVWVKFEAYDLTTDKTFKDLYIDIIKILPKGTPIYGLSQSDGKDQSANSKGYIYVNNKWVLIKGIHGFAKLINNK